MAEEYILSVSNQLFFVCFLLVISERTWLHSEELKFVAKKVLLLRGCMGVDRIATRCCQANLCLCLQLS